MPTLTKKTEEIIKIIDEQNDFMGLDHLSLFKPKFRDEDESFRVFETTNKQLYLTSDQLSISSDEAGYVYRWIWTTSIGEGLWLDTFARGICATTVFIDESEIENYCNFIRKTLDLTEQHQEYPAISKAYEKSYSNVALTILNNDEISNRAHLMAYNHGIWWVMGHLNGIDKMKLPYNSDYLALKTVRAPEWVESVLTNRAQLAVIEEV